MVKPRSPLYDAMSGQSGGQLQGVGAPRRGPLSPVDDILGTGPRSATPTSSVPIPRPKPSLGSGSKPATVVPKPKPKLISNVKGFSGAQGGGGIGTMEELRNKQFKSRRGGRAYDK